MSTDQNKEVVILWLEERNKGNWNIINELFATDYVCHLASDPEPIRGRDKVKQMNVGSRWAFDIYPTHEPDLLIAESDLVVHRETVRLKPKDPFRGMPPTEKEATVANIDIYRIVNGRIVEQWSHPDRFGAMQQLGDLPTQGTLEGRCSVSNIIQQAAVQAVHSKTRAFIGCGLTRPPLETAALRRARRAAGGFPASMHWPSGFAHLLRR